LQKQKEYHKADFNLILCKEENKEETSEEGRESFLDRVS